MRLLQTVACSTGCRPPNLTPDEPEPRFAKRLTSLKSSDDGQSLTGTYAKIVDANYPEINTVDGICKLNPETLASGIVGSEDYAKRFKELKSQYAAATNCASNVEQAFRNVTLTDMTQPPELLKSMIASIDGDGADMSEADKQISDLAEKMEASYKAMRTVTKIYHAMCMNEKAAQQSSR